MDLLDDAAMGPLAGAQAANPLGLPPAKRRRKSGSNKTLFIALGSLAGVGLLVVCGGIAVALLLPAIEGARQAAMQAQARNTARHGLPVAEKSSSVPAAPTGAIWTPDSQLLSQLTTSVSIDRYRLQLPADFTVVRSPSKVMLKDGAVQTATWMSPPRSHMKRRALIVTLIDYHSVPRGSITELEAAIASELRAWQSGAGLTVATQTSAEAGQLDGKQFLRSRFTIVEDGGIFNGTVLAGFDGKRILSLMSTCPDPLETLDYQLLDAAMLTFRTQ